MDFIGPRGTRLRRSNFAPFLLPVLARADLPQIRFYDLRHTGNL